MRVRMKKLAWYFGLVTGFIILRVTVYEIGQVGPFLSPNRPASLRHQGFRIHPSNNSDNSGVHSVRLAESVSQRDDQLASILRETSKSCAGIERPEKSSVEYRNGYWQMLRTATGEVFMISAFFDDRPVVGLLPVVRLLAVSARLEGDLYCQVWYAGYSKPYVSLVEITKSGRGDTFDGVKYEQSLYTCQLPVSRPAPSHVSVTSGSCGNSTMYIPLNIPVRAAPQNEFGVCVAIAFGSMRAKELVEWFEFNRLLGVTEFNIYDGNISPDMNKLFQYYIREGYLHVYAMPPPVMDFRKKGIKLSSPASLNDCMMRNMYRYQYMVTIDFDEFIIPVKHSNYIAMLRDINLEYNLSSPAQSYTFRNVYHFKNFPEDPSQPSYLKTMRSRNHGQPSKFLYAAKSFVDPKTCLSVFNHFCYKRFQPGKNFTVDVDVKFAASHHYRKCDFDRKKCQDISKSPVLDDTVLRFKRQLSKRVERVLTDLGEPL